MHICRLIRGAREATGRRYADCSLTAPSRKFSFSCRLAHLFLFYVRKTAKSGFSETHDWRTTGVVNGPCSTRKAEKE